MEQFDIRNFSDCLLHDGGSQSATEFSYHCPICGAKNFKVCQKTGKYQTFGCDCASTDSGKKAIRDKVAPLYWEKSTRPKRHRTWDYYDSAGNPILQVHRTDDGNNHRTIWQKSLVNGKSPKELIPQAMPYNFEAAKAAQQRGERVYWVEGEGVVDALNTVGLVAVTTIRGSGGYNSEQYRGLLDPELLVICPDRDEVGMKYAHQVALDYPQAKWLYALPDSPLWQQLPKDGGLDLADWIDQLKREGLDSEAIKAKLLAAVEDHPCPPDSEDAEDIEDDFRPVIMLAAGRLTRNIDLIEVHLSNTKDPREKIYVQGGQDGYYLVRLLRAVPDHRKHLIEVSPDADSLDLLTVDSLLFEFNKRFRFERWDSRKQEYQACDCPRTIATHFLQKGAWPNLPRLTGLSQIPLLCRDGQVVTEPGYHAETGMLLQFIPSDFPPIPTQASKEHAEDSLAVIRDWLKEFPFQKPEHESVAISEVLTSVSRRILRQAPLHATSATKAGSGKGTKAKGTAILVMGGHPGTIPYTGESEEFRKKITSFLKTGQPLGLIDNVTGILGGDVLEQVLTEPFFKDRLLGGNLMPKFSTQVLLIANGNNLRFRPDMTRRTMLCVLDPEMESPETREFERDFESYTHKHRGELVAAGLTILKAYIQSGYPDKLKPLGSFADWSNLVRSALVWLGMPDPVRTQQEIREQDDHRITLGAFLQAWHDQYPPVIGRPVQKTAREICSEAVYRGKGDLRDILLEVALDRSGEISPRKLSYFLRANHRSVVGNLRLETEEKNRLGYALWSVVTVSADQQELSSASSASSAESATPMKNQSFEGAEDHKLSSAGPNNGKSMVSANCAEDAEDHLRQVIATVITDLTWEDIE